MVSRSKFHWIPSIIFEDNSKFCFSQNSFASSLNYSKTIPYCVLAEIQLHLVEIILRQSQFFSWPKSRCIPSKLFQDNSIWFLSRFQLHLIEIVLRQFQLVSWPKFHWISLHLFKGSSRWCLSRIQLHLIEIVLRQFQIVSWPKFHWISSFIF